MNPKQPPPPPSSTPNTNANTNTNTNTKTNSKMEESKQQQQLQQLQQQQAAIARFPSNIDAHLRPLGSFRPLHFPIPISKSTSSLSNPNFPSHPRPLPKLTPPPPSLPPQLQLKLTPPSLLPKHSSDPPIRDTLPLTDDAFFTVRDRKVRISDRNAIYALCRSWLRNGYREESQFQPQYGDVFKSLPKPLPLAESSTLERKEIANEVDGEEEDGAETLSAEELLQRHIKRAKRVRERLKEERMRRIKRYKSRLKLLLPPPIDQCRGDIDPS